MTSSEQSAGEIERKLKRVKERQYLMMAILSVIGCIVALKQLSENIGIVIAVLFLVAATLSISAFWHSSMTSSKPSDLEVS